ncbi:DDE_Tnp_IS1595 domain-containing protein [Nephila pilipes]|uniref:DDE_Tnp_IS1595 domain-containing protein n=1 Tax=Nephila pilipes TaxID=299642 RepID=A0A8X6T4Q7_NEPPI|nr:DDE_Tnp_IS1595 domain-containing protein [Nephila pilipes]
MLFLDFLRETGLIKSECICHKCNSPMKFAAKNSLSDGYSWICRKSTNNKVCGATKTIRHGSWFTCSKLRLGEIFMLTFEIILGSATSEIGQTYSFSSATLADWSQFINEVILDYVENNSEKIGGAGKIVEVDESKFGKRKYHRGHAVEGQWVFGGVERGSGKLFTTFF